MGSWFRQTVPSFLAGEVSAQVNALKVACVDRNLPITAETVRAWEETVHFLQEALQLAVSQASIVRKGTVLLEYEIPRRPLRLDAVVLVGGCIIIVEMKIGAHAVRRDAILQVAEYALDLRDFHEQSRHRMISPVVVATGMRSDLAPVLEPDSELEVERFATPGALASLIAELAQEHEDDPIDPRAWDESAYQPSMSILEAARELFAGHHVREISHAHANNLDSTVAAVQNIIRKARTIGEKHVLFVTGVPGSGKTLAGLSAVHLGAASDDATAHEALGAYLSGNGPLVQVLQYALTKDSHARTGLPMHQAKRRASAFIQPVHLFLREYAHNQLIPPDNVIVFDEAQRAWSRERNRQKAGIDASEASTILEIMDRRPDWAVVVALVGQGQEINAGEAGLAAWADALRGEKHWSVSIAPGVGTHFVDHATRPRELAELHLAVNVRSPRAQAVASWADHVVSGSIDEAAETRKEFARYPVYITRDLNVMRRYLRDRARPDRRTGLLASAQARRLRPFGIEMDSSFQGGVQWPQWFVEGAEDVRSSYALEVAASEFKRQGLEIDWAGLCWGDDFTWDPEVKRWTARKISGPRWISASHEHAVNRYRVLLTRARHGLVLWVPKPDGHELLINGDTLDATADVLRQCGAALLE